MAQTNFKLAKIKKYVTKHALELIYKQAILPFVEYCDIIIDSGQGKEDDKLQRLQNRALRIIHDIRDPREYSVNNLHKNCNLQPLRMRREIHLLSVIHKCSADDSWVKTQETTTRSKIKVIFQLDRPRLGTIQSQSLLQRGSALG